MTADADSFVDVAISPQSVDILGVDIDRISTSQLLDMIDAWIARRGVAIRGETPIVHSPCHQVCTVNPEFVMDARVDAVFATVLRAADLRVADGVGVFWAARLQGVSLPERVTGSDGIYAICERAAIEGWRVFFLGATPGVAHRAARSLSSRYSDLVVAGTYAGSPQARDWPLIEQRLLDADADVLLVAYGHPRQDFWINAHRSELPVAVAIGLGGAFDFVAGVTTRAPVWMRKLGLEWLHRLVSEPWRWRRMTKLPVFAALSIRQAFIHRLR